MSKTVRIDHAKAAGAFLQKPDHVAFHDKRLWDLRSKRDAQAHGIPEWETMRNLASQIKEHTLSNLADYIAQFVDQETRALINDVLADTGSAAYSRLTPQPLACASRPQSPSSPSETSIQALAIPRSCNPNAILGVG